jgi:molecular chaperone GrpE
MAKKNKNLEEVTENEKVTEETAEQPTAGTDDIIAKKDEEINALNDRYQRLLAEYDNFKKRTVKEKEAIYTDSVRDTVAELLPVIDNLLRAVDAFKDKESDECKGVAMVLKQTEDIFAKIGVTQIEAVGQQFNPEFHNAVMHVDDDSFEDNTVVEEFQKGYIYKDKVIRYSMVKVAN